jgi:hypothetical protein
MLHRGRTILAVWLATTLAGCVAPAASTPTAPASPFDPQTLSLRGYADQAGSPSEDVESETHGVISERDGKITLWFEGVLPGRLTVLGTRLQGVMSSDSVPSSITTRILDRVP